MEEGTFTIFPISPGLAPAYFKNIMATSMLRVGRAGAKSLRRHGRLMGTGIVVCAIVPTVYSVSHADAQVAALPLAGKIGSC